MAKIEYIPELSEVRMVQRAPEGPLGLTGGDLTYVVRCLRQVECAFGLDAFPGVPLTEVSTRALIRQLIEWWRTLVPQNEAQREAHGQLPGAIRLIDTFSSWVLEHKGRGN